MKHQVLGKSIKPLMAVLAGGLFLATGGARGDVVTQWNETSTGLVLAGIKSPLAAHHTLSMVQTGVYESVNAITQKYPQGVVKIDAEDGASLDAAVARANYSMLLRMMPDSEDVIEQAYQAAIGNIADDAAKAAGVAVADQAVAAVVHWRENLKGQSEKSEPLRPVTAAGVYVPTVVPVAYGWSKRPTWILDSPDQYRPEPPPKLGSETWARDYNEVAEYGGANSSKRSEAQTEIALFWEATAPAIYYPVIRSVASMPDRDVTQNARLLAVAGRAMDDALVAVFDAKYAYRFWRPVTAIRNGDIDDSDATERMADWKPLIKTPMHPEYPCAHCVVSGAVAGVLATELDGAEPPLLSTTSPKLPGVTRSWNSIEDFAQEVINARIYDGVHYRTSGDVGSALGKKIGTMTMEKAKNL